MTTSRAARAAWTALLALAVAGCGTTVPMAGGQPTAGTTDGLGVPSATTGTGVGASGTGRSGPDAGAPGSTSALGGGAVTGTGAGSGPRTTGPASPGSTAASAGAVASGVVGPGVVGDKVYIGVGYSTDAAAANKAAGAAGAAPSYDTRSVYNAVIDYANKHGGFDGRRIVPLYYNFTTTADVTTQEQAACAYWTQDHKVFALYSNSDILDACAEKAGALAIFDSSATDSTYRKYSHLIDPSHLTLNSLAVATVNGLQKAGYFAGKLGLVTWDDPNYTSAMKESYVPTLAGLNITPLKVVYVTPPQSFGAIGDMTAQIHNYVLQFRTLGIDHVIIADGHAGLMAGGGLSFAWMQDSKSQRYYPRYGQNANDVPGYSIDPPDEMDHALAITNKDDDRSNDQGWHINRAREKCFAIQAAAGLPVDASHSRDESFAADACDLVFLLQHVMNTWQVANTDTFMRVATEIGRTFQPAAVYGTRFAPGIRDGGSVMRTAEYFASCQCLRYRGAPYETRQ